MLNYVHVPPVNEIKAWSQLDVMPIVETEPDAVPLPNVLRYPCNDNFNRLLETKIDLPSKSIAIIIKQLDGHIKNVDSYIAEFYSRRGLTRPLQSYIQRLKGEQNTTETPMQFKTEEAKMLANAFFIPQLEYLKRVKNDCTEIASFITSIFSEEKIWKEGQYCDVLLDNICILLYKLTALEQLAPSKKGIINDLSTFNALSNNSSQSRDAMEIRMWISDFHSSTSLLLGSLSKLEPELTVIIFNIIFEYITKQLEEDNFLIPDIQYSYIAALIFMVNFYEKQKKIEEDSMKSKKKPKYKIKPLKEKVKIFLINLCELHPNIPLIFEFAGQTNANIPPELLKLSKSSSSYAPNLTNYSLDDITNKLHRLTQDFSKILALTKIPKSKTIENSKKLVDILPKILHIIALGMNNTREILAQILSHPPQTPEGTNMKPYEKSMKIGLTPQISPMLIFLSNVKTAKELIISNEPIIYENVCSYIEYYCQNLSYTVIPSIVSKSSAYKTSMGKIMKVLRVLSGLYTEDDYKSENKKKSKLKIPNLSSPPHLAVLEFLRIQIQMMVNPESPFASKSGVFKSPPLSDSDIKDLQAFLSDSKYFNELICLSDTLLTVSDQSNLFFKEYYLSADGSSFFPVTTSLPYIFSEYAMDNYQKPELTGVILNPLSIYDDAASKSLRYLRSKYLYEEIKEESKICLMSITRKLADSAFHPMRRFASIRAFKKVVVDEALGQKKTNTLKENISVMRLGIILQQNRLCLLGCFIDTKSLITERLNDIFDEEITQIIDFIGKQGIRAVIAMSRLILVLKRVHGIMVNFGLPLMPFDDLFARATYNDTPNSCQSLLLFNIAEHFNHDIEDLHLISSPLRLVPNKTKKIDFRSFLLPPLGDLMNTLLLPSTSLVSVENFRELFLYLEDGTISILHQQLGIILNETLDDFIASFWTLQSRLTRIKNGEHSINAENLLDRFIGAYRYFTDDTNVKRLFVILKAIGNILAISEMMDDAYLSKRLFDNQNASFILTKNMIFKNTENIRSEFFSLFDNEFKSSAPHFSSLQCNPAENEVVQPFLNNSLYQIYTKVGAICSENSQNLLDVTSLTGFEAVYVVLEFLFVYLEITKDRTNPGALQMYGEGVMAGAAAILLVTNQQNLYNSFSICETIVRRYETDFSVVDNPTVRKFAKVYSHVYSAMKLALTTYQPAVDTIFTYM